MSYKAIHKPVPAAVQTDLKIRNLKMHVTARPVQEQAGPVGREQRGGQHAAPTHVPFGWEMGRLASLRVVLNT